MEFFFNSPLLVKVLGGVEVGEPSDQDVFLLCKQFMHSTFLTQKPLLVLPANRLSRLPPGGPGKVVPRNDLGERTINEFRKTARAVEQRPWCLIAASHYLYELCENNEKKRWPNPPVLKFINTPVEELVPLIDQRDNVGLPVELTDFAPGTPRKVEVGERPKPGGADARRNRGRGGGKGRGGKGRGGKGRGRGGKGDDPALTVGPVAPEVEAPEQQAGADILGESEEPKEPADPPPPARPPRKKRPVICQELGNVAKTFLKLLNFCH